MNHKTAASVDKNKFFLSVKAYKKLLPIWFIITMCLL